jgi:hypothetical protein
MIEYEPKAFTSATICRILSSCLDMPSFRDVLVMLGVGLVWYKRAVSGNILASTGLYRT